MGRLWRFDGWIAGVGTAGGVRVVIGVWRDSPFGPFGDAMVQDADGHRVLVAPPGAVAEFVASTYRFDEVVTAPVRVTYGSPLASGAAANGSAPSASPSGSPAGASAARGAAGEPAASGSVWVVEGGPLIARLTLGRRPALGRLLRLVPPPLASRRWWVSALDPVARSVLPGVRTRGSAGAGRAEWYAALDLHRVAAAAVTWRGVDRGALRPLRPPVTFGFGSAPATPAVVRVVTWVRG